MIPETILSAPTKQKKVFKCPICKIKCRNHCWNYSCLKEIGKDIEWYHDKQADKSMLIEKDRAPNGDVVPHKCLKGQYINNGQISKEEHSEEWYKTRWTYIHIEEQDYYAFYKILVAKGKIIKIGDIDEIIPKTPCPANWSSHTFNYGK